MIGWRTSTNRIEINNFLLRNNIVKLGPLMQVLALLIEALLLLAKHGAIFGAPIIRLEARAVRQTVQVHLGNGFDRRLLRAIRDERRHTVRLDALRRRIETNARNRAKTTKPFVALEQLRVAQTHRQAHHVHNVLLANAHILQLLHREAFVVHRGGIITVLASGSVRGKIAQITAGRLLQRGGRATALRHVVRQWRRGTRRSRRRRRQRAQLTATQAFHVVGDAVAMDAMMSVAFLVLQLLHRLQRTLQLLHTRAQRFHLLVLGLVIVVGAAQKIGKLSIKIALLIRQSKLQLTNGDLVLRTACSPLAHFSLQLRLLLRIRMVLLLQSRIFAKKIIVRLVGVDTCHQLFHIEFEALGQIKHFR